MPRMWSIVKFGDVKGTIDCNPDTPSRKRAREDTPPRAVLIQNLPSTPGKELSLEVSRILSPLPLSLKVSVGIAEQVQASPRQSRLKVCSNPTEGFNMQLEQADTDAVKEPQLEANDDILRSLATEQVFGYY